MPTIMVIFGLRFFFYSKEESRMHVHVEQQGRELKIWLDTFEIAYNRNFPEHDVLEIIKLVRRHEKSIKKAWNAHFG